MVQRPAVFAACTTHLVFAVRVAVEPTPPPLMTPRPVEFVAALAVLIQHLLDLRHRIEPFGFRNPPSRIAVPVNNSVPLIVLPPLPLVFQATRIEFLRVLHRTLPSALLVRRLGSAVWQTGFLFRR